MENKKDYLLEVKHLRTSFFTTNGEVKAVNDVSFHVNRGEVVAIVGESGCGKSVTQMSIMQLVQSPPGKILGGEVIFNGKNLLEYGPNSKEMRSIRGDKIAMIFQEPMTALDPVMTIGDQLVEVIRTHRNVSRKEARVIAEKALDSVGIPDAKARLSNYPFEMSGGMRQRAMIATAVACESELLIADEPTTALDVTTQAQVMELLVDIVHKRGMSLIIVTHNLGVVNRYADRIYVMYAGHVVEQGTTEQILKYPHHPYTEGLLASVPKLEEEVGEKLVPIPGTPPNLTDIPDICPFIPRCRYVCDKCRNSAMPPLEKAGDGGRYLACYVDIHSNEVKDNG